MPAADLVRSRARALALLLIAAGAPHLRAAAGAPSEAIPSDALPERHLCAEPAGPVALGAAQWNGWGRDLDNSRYQPEPALRATDVPKLALKWAFGYRGSAVAGQPTVVDGRVFVASATGRVYALDAKTACTYWTYDAQAGVRTALSIGELAPQKVVRAAKHRKAKRTPAHLEVLKAPSAVFFGDDAGAVYALDAAKGTLLWKTQVDGHPTARIEAAQTILEGRLYVSVASSEPSAAADTKYACCTFRGSVAALDMSDGRVLWKTHTVNEVPRPYRRNATGVQEFGPAGVPVLDSPTIDAGRNLLYVATGGSYTALDQPLADAVVALDLHDGAVRWVKQLAAKTAGAAPEAASAGAEGVGAGAGSAGEFQSAPILRTLASGEHLLLAGQRSGTVYALDPDRAGEILWQNRLAAGKVAGGVEWGAAADHHSLYVALSGLTADPADTSGSLTAIDLKTGATRWQTSAPSTMCAWGAQACAHAQTQAVTVIPGVAFSGSMDGHLRAYSTIDGKILWDYQTAKDYSTVNGVHASGGSLDQGGATIVNGVLYVNSGYGQRSGQPGNALLAFSVNGK